MEPKDVEQDASRTEPTWQQNRMDVEKQWHTPDGVRFRVRCGNGRYFELFYDEMKDEWQVKPA